MKCKRLYFKCFNYVPRIQSKMIYYLIIVQNRCAIVNAFNDYHNFYIKKGNMFQSSLIVV